MRVNIDNKWYNSNEQIITIALSEAELNQLKSMEAKTDGSTRLYLSAPDSIPIEQIKQKFAEIDSQMDN